LAARENYAAQTTGVRDREIERNEPAARCPEQMKFLNLEMVYKRQQIVWSSRGRTIAIGCRATVSTPIVRDEPKACACEKGEPGVPKLRRYRWMHEETL